MTSLSRYRWRLMTIVGVCAVALASVQAQSSIAHDYRAPVARIIAEATSTTTATQAWDRLAELTDKYPARLSGSASLEGAIAWAAAQMKRDGLANVRLERVMVPHWVRGEESGAIVRPFPQPLAIAALGGSVGTAGDGVEGEALVVPSFAELESRAADVKGKIVVYNVAYDESADPGVAYRAGTRYRGAGASRAAAHGAVAALVRSVGPVGHRTPHTGAMRYTDDAPQIPVAAIAAEDAAKLQRMQDRGERVTVRLTLGARTLPDAESANVIAELPGRERPDEVVLVGGHLDSWDLASGAMDDGGGCVAMWEVLRVLQRLDLRPRRTIRLVLFTNEENGGRGGQGYRDKYRDQLANHVLAMESDGGVLPLEGYSFVGTDKARAIIAQIGSLLTSLGGTEVNSRFDGADIAPLMRAGNVPGLSPDVDMRRYFFVHHTPADTVDKVVPAELARVIAGMAAIAYVVADMPEPLDRAPVAQ